MSRASSSRDLCFTCVACLAACRDDVTYLAAPPRPLLPISLESSSCGRHRSSLGAQPRLQSRASACQGAHDRPATWDRTSRSRTQPPQPVRYCSATRSHTVYTDRCRHPRGVDGRPPSASGREPSSRHDQARRNPDVCTQGRKGSGNPLSQGEAEDSVALKL